MYDLTLALGIIAVILAFGLLIFGGIASKKVSFILGLGHIACVIVMTGCCLADSFSACAVCSVIAGAVGGMFLVGILIWRKKREIYYEDKAVRVWFWIIIFIDLASCISCYFSIFAFIDVAIACLIVFALGCACIKINKEYEVGVIALNAVFCVAALAGSIVGFVMYGSSKQPLNCIVTCEVYEYDESTAEAGDKISGELEQGEYYAVRFGFEWENVMGLANNAKEMRIYVNFPNRYPGAVKGYISEGLVFNSTSEYEKIVWNYAFTADIRMQSQFYSGYFIVNYSGLVDLEDSMATAVDVPFEIRIFEDKEGEADLIASNEFTYSFRKSDGN